MLQVRSAVEADRPAIFGLAGEVEHWFGPMVAEPGFHRALDSHIADERALVASDEGQPVGAVLFGGSSPRYAVHWLVISERARGLGVGRRLMAAAIERLTAGQGLAEGEVVDVVTFGADHPGAVAGGARVFYERLGFVPAEPAPDGPEGGSRQVFRYQRTEAVRFPF
ncbi:GNAT family N-acetyltransferase [Kribbella sp. NPDC003505]|uniref:GNAT family N-acetyltransferase n=1 Tax=Kribbella sp. NPDC003505 TaxID=3154448 RepID=UPI0033BC6041